MNEILVSIIVPVYNTEEYLKDCLDSLITQRYGNIEILLVNDGSTDSSGLICDSYAQKDGRIQVIHQENIGVSGARNTGLKAAKGDYISFVDSDDTISDDHILNMVVLANGTHDIACVPIKNDLPKSCEKILSGTEGLKAVIYKDHDNYMWYTVNKLFRQNIASNIAFLNDEYYGEDFSFIWKAFIQARTIAFGTKKTYFYRQSSTSINYASFDKKHLSYLLVSKRFASYVRDNKLDLENEAEYVYIRVLYRLLNIMLQGGKDQSLHKSYALQLKQKLPGVSLNKNVPLQFKMKLFLKAYFDKLYFLLWKIARYFEVKNAEN